VKLRTIFLILAGLFLVIAGGVWYRSTPLEKQATKISDDSFQIDIPQGVWVDTGVWVNPNYKVRAESNQSFYLAVDSASEQALVDAQNQRFRISIWTFSESVRLNLIPGAGPGRTALIGSQGKIYRNRSGGYR
jgi:hypothetical protein